MPRIGIDCGKKQFIAVRTQRWLRLPAVGRIQRCNGREWPPDVKEIAVVVLVEDFIFRDVQVDVVRVSPGWVGRGDVQLPVVHGDAGSSVARAGIERRLKGRSWFEFLTTHALSGVEYLALRGDHIALGFVALAPGEKQQASIGREGRQKFIAGCTHRGNGCRVVLSFVCAKGQFKGNGRQDFFHLSHIPVPAFAEHFFRSGWKPKVFFKIRLGSFVFPVGVGHGAEHVPRLSPEERAGIDELQQGLLCWVKRAAGTLDGIEFQPPPFKQTRHALVVPVKRLFQERDPLGTVVFGTVDSLFVEFQRFALEHG